MNEEAGLILKERICSYTSFWNKLNRTPLGFKMLFALFLIAPFSLPIDCFVFGNQSIFGMSVPNFTMTLLLVLCFVAACRDRRKASPSYLVATMILIMATMINVAIFGSEGCAKWLTNHEYYFTVPLVLYCLAAYKEFIDILIKQSLSLSALIGLAAIVFFLQDDYCGMVTYETMLQYDVVGMPFSRMMATFASPNVAGTYFAVMLYMDLHSAYGCPMVKWARRTLQSICLFLSFSRTAIFAFLICIGVELILGLRRTGKHFTKKRYGMRLATYVAAAAAIALVLLASKLLAKSGLYFFDFLSPEFLQNARIEKWAAFLGNGSSTWFIGEPLDGSFEYAGVSLSDNSILLSIASFGMIAAAGYWIALAVGVKADTNSVKSIIPTCVMLLVFLILSDFMQLFPAVYCMSLLLVYMSRLGANNPVKIMEG